jgi:hypothetical protein
MLENASASRCCDVAKIGSSCSDLAAPDGLAGSDPP